MSFPGSLPGRPAWNPTPEEKLEVERRKALVKAESLEAKRKQTVCVGNSGHFFHIQSKLYSAKYPRTARVYHYRGPSFS